jgi:uncharacterized protein YdhG (YjbR/CyaY superfamily)
MKSTTSTPDGYIAKASRENRKALERLRRVIRSSAPGSDERISYGMLTFHYRGALVGLGHFKDHLSFFPMSPKVLNAFRDELSGFATSKGTIRFSASRPIPNALVLRIVKARLEENEARYAGKTRNRRE